MRRSRIQSGVAPVRASSGYVECDRETVGEERASHSTVNFTCCDVAWPGARLLTAIPFVYVPPGGWAVSVRCAVCCFPPFKGKSRVFPLGPQVLPSPGYSGMRPRGKAREAEPRGAARRPGDHRPPHGSPSGWRGGRSDRCRARDRTPARRPERLRRRAPPRSARARTAPGPHRRCRCGRAAERRGSAGWRAARGRRLLRRDPTHRAAGTGPRASGPRSLCPP